MWAHVKCPLPSIGRLAVSVKEERSAHADAAMYCKQSLEAFQVWLVAPNAGTRHTAAAWGVVAPYCTVTPSAYTQAVAGIHSTFYVYQKTPCTYF